MQDLSLHIEGNVRENAPLAPYSTFRIGGAAKFFVEPTTISDVIRTQEFARDHALPFFILGNGSNVLISDEGWDGIVMNLETGFNKLTFESDVITAEAGVKMATFVDFSIRHKRKGVEMLAGIPATIGGAVWMNAGCYGGETSDHLIDVQLVRDGKYISLPKSDCGFQYRHSGFRKSDIILSARFGMSEGDPQELREIKIKLLKHRNEVQPVNIPNCGSVFKNPKPRFSAELIEAEGLKGTRIGGAEISNMHANFIVNVNKASAQDVISLMNLARKKVFESTGIVLEPEVQLIGFKKNPILPLP
ncbi:MAG: UDP-N-acetylmuramate dehydrogenase [Bacteroidota bacterium]|nr:UDP-N-acetylmuramate dehydrogenase [Bacteroidota bacterium]MDP4228831.1 UDP-N-acetylmuramate dehydrogenase [Bacteroidota bacterium]MDP4235137.1 UDP-N-acetylmuramate dehydrogenase [Bacteroidota bacterium]